MSNLGKAWACMMGDVSPLTHRNFGSTVSDFLISVCLQNLFTFSSKCKTASQDLENTIKKQITASGDGSHGNVEARHPLPGVPALSVPSSGEVRSFYFFHYVGRPQGKPWASMQDLKRQVASVPDHFVCDGKCLNRQSINSLELSATAMEDSIWQVPWLQKD